VKAAALAEVLAQKTYDFEKPAPLRERISHMFGAGLFVAEGEVHKVITLLIRLYVLNFRC
jgi:hypothetical protein